MYTILVVDDHPSVREVIRSMLESRGFIVVLARDGEAALAAFEPTRFDAALIDVDMPGMTGLELVRELRCRSEQMDRKFRAVLMTGVPRSELVAVSLEVGASAVLGKPFTMAELIATIERLCSAASMARAAA